MRIVHISAGDYGSGASRAAYRLHRQLCNRNVQSIMTVGVKLTEDPTVIGSATKLNKLIFLSRRTADTLPQRLYRNRSNLPWSNELLPGSLVRKAMELDPDVVVLHWIANGAVGLRDLASIDVPVVWVLHDYWPFTGGCHLIGDCTGYRKNCGSCPQLNSGREFDLSRINHTLKLKTFSKLNLTPVAPSSWVAECAAASTIFKDRPAKVIAHGLDPDRFVPLNKTKAKKELGIDPKKQVVLFGSAFALTDSNKGFDLFRAAMRQLVAKESSDRLHALIFGADESVARPSMPVETDFYGYILDDDKLNLFYAAADVMVFPSRQETFGQTVLEAFSCKTPVVAFDATGPRDVIEHRKSGYLARPYDPQDLCRGIKWILDDNQRRNQLGENARKRLSDKFSADIMTDNYLNLFGSLQHK